MCFVGYFNHKFGRGSPESVFKSDIKSTLGAQLFGLIQHTAHHLCHLGAGHGFEQKAFDAESA